jgi:hypothetical protein
MPLVKKSRRKPSRKPSRKTSRKPSRKTSRKTSRKQYSKSRKATSRRYRFKYEQVYNRDLPKTKEFTDCYERGKRKYKKWPRSGAKRASMIKSIQNACLKELKKLNKL